MEPSVLTALAGSALCDTHPFVAWEGRNNRSWLLELAILSAVTVKPYNCSTRGANDLQVHFQKRNYRFRNGFCDPSTVGSVLNVVAEDENIVRVCRKDCAENFGFPSIIIIIGTSNFNIAAICCERKTNLFLVPPFVFFARFPGSVSLVVISQASCRRYAGQLPKEGMTP
jgi:hypothetical protein